MALKPTIFKYALSVSDIDSDYYDTLNLTVAQHPSETTERMVVRVLAYVLNAAQLARMNHGADEVTLAFTAGLSTPDEPDICARSLDDRLLCWIDVGEPMPERIKKATRLISDRRFEPPARIYSFNSKGDTWWRQEQQKFASLPVAVYQMPWHSVQSLAALVQRNVAWSITISDATLYIACDQGSAEVALAVLQ